jgi:hypothetical protein
MSQMAPESTATARLAQMSQAQQRRKCAMTPSPSTGARSGVPVAAAANAGAATSVAKITAPAARIVAAKCNART